MKELEITSRRPIQLIHSGGVIVNGTITTTIENDRQMDEIERASELGMLSYKVVGESNEMVVEEKVEEKLVEEKPAEEPTPEETEEPPKEEAIEEPPVKEDEGEEPAVEETTVEEPTPEENGDAE